MGMEVHVLEKRETFSRVNILTLWKQTADDLMSFGAKLSCPKFTNHGDLLHLGTREIQLVLFKSALLLGVTVHAGTEVIDDDASAVFFDRARGGPDGQISNAELVTVRGAVSIDPRGPPPPSPPPLLLLIRLPLFFPTPWRPPPEGTTSLTEVTDKRTRRESLRRPHQEGTPRPSS